MKSKDHCQSYDVDECEREETHINSLLEALLVEHGHVDAVGGEADEEEDGGDNGGLDSLKEVLCLKSDDVVGVVPWDGYVHGQDDATVRNIAR